MTDFLIPPLTVEMIEVHCAQTSVLTLYHCVVYAAFEGVGVGYSSQ